MSLQPTHTEKPSTIQRPRRPAERNLQRALALLIIGVLLGGALLLMRRGPGAGREVVLFCAAGVRAPVQEIIDQYEKECGVRVRVQYGGSPQSLKNIELGGKADLFIGADYSDVERGRKKGVLAEVIPLATMRAVIAVPRGNPLNIRGLDDLLRPEVRVALANPEQAAIGKITMELLGRQGKATELLKRAAVLKPTVTDLANDVKIGSADAAIVWDATVKQYPELQAVDTPAFEQATTTVSVAVVAGSCQPAAALHFARYLAAADRGSPIFERCGFPPVPGDAWASSPEILFLSGAVNRPAIEEVVRQFELREGATVKCVYNGCGILVAQMKAGGQQSPDCYLACDVSFVPPVADLFLEPTEISGTQIVMAVPKGNPNSIKTLADLGRDGLKVGLANPEQSTLGELTRRILEREKLTEAVARNVRTQTPTADMLVTQLAVGSLDAVVVYEANLSKMHDKLDMIRLQVEGNKAVQPFTIGKNTQHRQLIERLLERIRSDESRRRYESLGFEWRVGREP